MKRIIVIACGRDTSEFEISLRSAQGTYSLTDKKKHALHIVEMYRLDRHVQLPDGTKAPVDRNDFNFRSGGGKVAFDFVYITTHGTSSEDGRLQRYLDMLYIPRSCCGVLAAVLTYDKFACNQHLRALGVRITDSSLFRQGQSISGEDAIDKVGLLCFIRPSLGGPSFGVAKIKTRKKIQPVIEKTFKGVREVLVEAFIQDMKITCGCYKTREKSVVFPVIEMMSHNKYFDYKAKYNDGSNGIASACIPDELRDHMQKLISTIYDILGATGTTRVDYIITGGERINLLEVNIIPGMTTTGFIPRRVRATNLGIKDIMTDVIESQF